MSPEAEMIRIIIWIASLITALTAGAKGEEGIASHYDRSSGSKVACGGKLDESALSAAHRTLPCGTRVRVENKQNGRSVTVTINDRGPYVRSRIIDLTPAAARALQFSGLARVAVTRE
jgi:rare lipoprotein A